MLKRDFVAWTKIKIVSFSCLVVILLCCVFNVFQIRLGNEILYQITERERCMTEYISNVQQQQQQGRNNKQEQNFSITRHVKNNDIQNLKHLLQTKQNINNKEDNEINNNIIFKKKNTGNNYYIDDIMITIWSNEPIVTIDENPIIITTEDNETNLYDRYDNVQYQLCSEHATNISEMKSMIENTYNNIYSCPISLSKIIPIEKRQHFFELFTTWTNYLNVTEEDNNGINITSVFAYDRYVHSQLEHIYLYLNESTYPNNAGNSSIKYSINRRKSTLNELQRKIHTISYWNWDLKRHISIDLPSFNDKRLLHRSRFRTCMDIDCPKQCNSIHNDRDDTTNEMMELDGLQIRKQWDINDELCKSNHPATRPPYRQYGGFCSCHQTCFTPIANDVSSSWPWSNQSQHDYFYPTGKTRDKQLRNCASERRQHTVVERFMCPGTTTTNNNTTNNGRNSISSSTSSSSTFNNCSIHAAAEHHFFFLPNSKLLFCGIPKVGITEWIKFFRFTYGAQDYLSFPHAKVDREEFLVKRLSLKKFEEIVLNNNDPSWTKAVFIRNPAERLLSAYLDKFIKEKYTTFERFSSSNNKVLSFKEFVDLVTYNNNNITTNITNNSTKKIRKRRPKPCGNDPRGLHWCTDPHWRPQIMTCGLDVLLPHFDFIGTIDYVSEQTKLLLEKVGLWETYGKVYNDGRSVQAKKRSMKTQSIPHKCNKPPPSSLSTNNNGDDMNNNTGVGFNQLGSSESYRHATNSKDLFQKYYTPELLAKVKKAYALDYAIWNDVRNRPSNQVTKGSDLQIVQNYCSK